MFPASLLKRTLLSIASQLTYSFVKNTSTHHLAANMSTAAAKPKIYLTRTLHPEAMEMLTKNFDVDSWRGDEPVPHNELLKNISGKQGLLCMLTDNVNQEVLTAGGELKVISTMSAGFDHLDLSAIRKRDIRVGHTPVILADATAELTVALLLATARRLFESNAEARAGGWSAWAPYWMCGQQVAGSTVGIVGLGQIGQEVALRLKPFKPKEIVYYNRSARDKEGKEIGARQVSFDELLAISDFVVVTVALTPDTSEMFNEERFKKMKPTSIFINTARGGIVNQDALVKALQNKTIAAAGLDVMTPEPLPTDHPLFQLKNCVILPHIGSATEVTRKAMAMLSIENLIMGLKGERMIAEVK